MTSHTSYILARTAPAAPGGVEYFTGLCDLVFAKPTNWLRPHVSVLLDEAKRYEAAAALNAGMTLVKHSERPDGCGVWHVLPVALHLPGYEPPPQAETAPAQPWQPQKKSAEERAHRRADADRRHREQLQQSMQWLLDDLHTAGETHDPQTGAIFDSVEDAAAALIEAGGNLNWYSPELAALYRCREAERRAPDARCEAPAPAQPCPPEESVADIKARVLGVAPRETPELKVARAILEFTLHRRVQRRAIEEALTLIGASCGQTDHLLRLSYIS